MTRLPPNAHQRLAGWFQVFGIAGLAFLALNGAMDLMCWLGGAYCTW